MLLNLQPEHLPQAHAPTSPSDTAASGKRIAGNETAALSEPPDRAAPDLRASHGFLTWYCRRLLLPRFRLFDVRRVTRQLPIEHRRTTSGPNGTRGELRRRLDASTIDTPVSTVALLGLVVAWTVVGVIAPIESPVSVMDEPEASPWRIAVVAAAAFPYGWLLLAILLGAGAPTTYPLALRLPAVAVLGASVLMPLGTVWYTDPHWIAVAALLLFAFGYLVIEATNHRVPRAPLRALTVLTLGLLHGGAVAILALGAAGGVFLPPVECDAMPADFEPCRGNGGEFLQPRGCTERPRPRLRQPVSVGIDRSRARPGAPSALGRPPGHLSAHPPRRLVNRAAVVWRDIRSHPSRCATP